MNDNVLFPTSIIGSMPRPRFVKELIADDSRHLPEDYERLMGSATLFYSYFVLARLSNGMGIYAKSYVRSASFT